MANTTVLKAAGKTYAIAVTATSSTSLTIDDSTNDQVNFATFLNAGAKACAITVSNLATAPVSVFPTVGTPGDFVLPANMTYNFSSSNSSFPNHSSLRWFRYNYTLCNGC